MPVVPRLTIPRRVFLAFVLLLTVGGLASVASLVQHQRNSHTLSLVHDGYMPLIVTVSEARAMQGVFENLLERMLTERDHRATRQWLETARQSRPATLGLALEGLGQIEELAPPPTERATLARLRREIKHMQTLNARGDERYGELFAALENEDRTSAQRILIDLQARERTVSGRLRGVYGTLLSRVKATSERASAQQEQAIALLAMLVVVSLVVGVIVTWWSQRVLSPLPRLQERVEAVARGELVHQQLGPNTDDEIGRLAREFERMVAALAVRDKRLIQSERLAAIGRMAAHVTHEVRNPLSSIGLNVEMLEEELVDAGDETRDLLAAIHREIEHLRGVTEEYLRLARVPNPQLEPEYLGELASSTAQFLRPELTAGGVDLEVSVEDTLPLVKMDEAQIRQVLLNLLKNAREAMPDGGKVRLSVRAEEQGVVVRIQDDGTGMDEEHRERIFDLFYTTKKLGTGLGLPLSQQIVLAHGGYITCESQPGEGTVFQLWFPVADSTETRILAQSG